MPKRISVKDTKQLYIAYKIGEINGVSYFNEVLPLRCQFSSFNGERVTNVCGTDFKYNAVAILEFNNVTKFIDEFTKFWYGAKPVDSNERSDYTVVRVGELHDGLFTIYLSSKTPNSDNIWYEIDGNIYTADVVFNREKLTVTVANNMYMPIWYTTKVWYRKPEDFNSKEYGIHLVDIDNQKTYTRYIFEEGLYEKVEGNE